MALSACATTGSGTGNIKARLNAGETGAIIAGLDSTHEFAGERQVKYMGGWLNIQNTETRDVTRYFLETDIEPTSAKAFTVWLQVTELPAGTYRVLSGKVQSGQTLQTLPLIGLWVEPFEVKPGHITNMGMLRVQNITVDTQDKDLTFMDVVKGRDDERFTSYVTYSTTPIPLKVLQSSLEDWADYKGVKTVSQPLSIRLSESDFRAAVLAASAPDTDGNAPSRADVSAKLQDSLQDMVSELR